MSSSHSFTLKPAAATIGRLIDTSGAAGAGRAGAGAGRAGAGAGAGAGRAGAGAGAGAGSAGVGAGSAGAGKAAGASSSYPCALSTLAATREEEWMLDKGGKGFRQRIYANRVELDEERLADIGLGFTPLDCLNDRALILEKEDAVTINVYTELSIPGFGTPNSVLTYFLPRNLFESLQNGLENYFVHQDLIASQVLTLSCQTLIKEILAGSDHLRDQNDLTHLLEKVSLHMTSWLAWMELAYLRASFMEDSHEGIRATVHLIIEEERVLNASGKAGPTNGEATSAYCINSTLSSISELLQGCVDQLKVPFSSSLPKRTSLSKKALVGLQHSQEEVLKPLQKLRLKLKQTLEAAIWIGSTKERVAFFMDLPLINIFGTRERDCRSLLIDWVEKLDAMLEQRIKMKMASRIQRVGNIKPYIHAFKQEEKAISLPLSSGIKGSGKMLFPEVLSLGFTLEKDYQNLLNVQHEMVLQYKTRIALPEIVSIALDPHAPTLSADVMGLPIYIFHMMLMMQSLHIYQMNAARRANRMLTCPTEKATYISHLHTTLGSIGWLELWKEIHIHEIPVSADVPSSVASISQSMNLLLRQLPVIDDATITHQLTFLYDAQKRLLNHDMRAFNVVYEYLASFYQIESLHTWTCAMSRHCILVLNTIKKNTGMSYEEIDQLIFLIETHRLMDQLKVSENLIKCYRTFIPEVPAPIYMADAFIALLVELRNARCLKESEASTQEAPMASLPSDAYPTTSEVAPDKEMKGPVHDSGRPAEDTAEEPLDPAIIDAMIDVMNAPSFNAWPTPIAPDGRAGAGASARASAGAGAGAARIAETSSLISDIQLKSIKDHRHLHRFLHAAGMQCLRENGGSHSTWGAAGVKFTVACHPGQELPPKTRQRIVEAVKTAHEAMKRAAEESSLDELATKMLQKSKGRAKPSPTRA